MILMNAIRSLPWHCIRLIPSRSILPDCHGYFHCLVNNSDSLLILEHETPYVRETAAKSLAAALPSQPDLFTTYLNKLIALYEDKVHSLSNQKLINRQNRSRRSMINMECSSRSIPKL